jgi:hypothetical protein
MNKLCDRISSLLSPVGGLGTVSSKWCQQRSKDRELNTFRRFGLCADRRTAPLPPPRGSPIRPDDPQMGRILFSRLWQSIEEISGERMPFKPVPIEINPRTVSYFWQRVDKSPHPKGCWMWAGSKVRSHKGNYGRMGYGRSRPGAHRFSWALHNGPIPEDMEICHSCDNPLCVNPEHLWLGTHHQNMLDCDVKDRRPPSMTKGNTPNRKLTAEQVIEISELLKQGVTRREIGKRYGVNPVTITAINLGKSWSHITGAAYDKPICASRPPGAKRHHKAKLTINQVNEIRSRLAQGESSYALAKEYRVSRSTIYSIKTRKQWSSIP